MASADYWLCDVCGGKTFYDRDLNWYASIRKRQDGRLMPCGAGDMAAICVECAETHEIIVQKKHNVKEGEPV